MISKKFKIIKKINKIKKLRKINKDIKENKQNKQNKNNIEKKIGKHFLRLKPTNNKKISLYNLILYYIY